MLAAEIFKEEIVTRVVVGGFDFTNVLKAHRRSPSLENSGYSIAQRKSWRTKFG